MMARSIAATTMTRNANYSAREPFRFTRRRYVADNGRLYRNQRTYALVISGRWLSRLTLINLINRNRAARVRFYT